jgi:hypothetical protein
MSPFYVCLAAFCTFGCGTGLDEGAAIPLKTAALWEENFTDGTVLASAMQEVSCSGSDPADWRVADGHLYVAGACIPFPQVDAFKSVRGTMVRFPDGRFSEGWLVARVFPGDDDTWSIVWGPERAPFRFSMYRTTERALLVMIASPGVDFAGNLNPAAPDTRRFSVVSSAIGVQGPFNRWSDVAVHRSPARTTVYLDRVPVLWFVGDPLWDGPVGFHTSRMDSFLVDHVAIYEPGLPPWERLASSSSDSSPRNEISPP